MIEQTIRSMQKRFSWTVGRSMLARAGYRPGLGWSRSIEKIRDQKQAGNEGRLIDQLVEHILCGDKFVKLYQMKEGEREKLQDWMLGYASNIETDGAPAAYPQLLSDDEVDKEPPETRCLAVEKNDAGIGLVLSSVFMIKAREELDFDLFEDPKDAKTRFDEVIGLKLKKVQIFSVIWVPHERNYAEIRVDYPSGMGVSAIHGYHSTFKKLVLDGAGIDLGAAVNLFPAVGRFYSEKHDGRVTGITFRTTTGAVKNESMLKRSNVDQREETYHLGGVGALDTDIALYRISVEWKFDEDEQTFAPNLSLSAGGPPSSETGGNPKITGVFIGNCVRTTDYELVIDRLWQMAEIAE